MSSHLEPHPQTDPDDYKPPVIASAADVDSEYSESFPRLLEVLGCSVVVSTYQAGRLVFLRARDGALNTHFKAFQKPMGMSFGEGQLSIGGHHEIWNFRALRDAARAIDGGHDAVFIPGTRHHTGAIAVHEIAWAGNELWAVNTRFSCLCTFDGPHSFVPRWRPPFVTELAADDRCHLNGLAVADGCPAYVTCHGETNAPAGWRERKATGGCIVHVGSGEVIARGLSMPHSPRFHDGKLWVLESGCGRLSVVDPQTGRAEPFAELPGFTRGLDFLGRFAFVGLSQVRESAHFSGLPIATRPERECGVWVIDLRSARVVAFVRFFGAVQEIFAVTLLPSLRFPELLESSNPLAANIFHLPKEPPVT